MSETCKECGVRFDHRFAEHRPDCPTIRVASQSLEDRVSKLEAMAHPPMDVTATVTQIADACARLWEADPHSFSTRGCQTCRAVSGLLARPFGCVAKAAVKP